MLAVKPDAIVNAIWGGAAVSLLKQGAQLGLWKQSTLVSMADLGGIEYRKPIGMDMPEGTWGCTCDDVSWPANDEQKAFHQAYYDFTGQKEPPASMVPGGYYIMKMIAQGIEKAGTTKALPVIKAMEGMKFHTYWADVTIRDFDHQVTGGMLWAPMIKKEGVPYLLLDGSRVKYLPCGPDLLTKDEWIAARKAAGKIK
jgi:branched-chain amino acid transport system substrate-binding protein